MQFLDNCLILKLTLPVKDVPGPSLWPSEPSPNEGATLSPGFVIPAAAVPPPVMFLTRHCASSVAYFVQNIENLGIQLFYWKTPKRIA
jgi:hypothetical protein